MPGKSGAICLYERTRGFFSKAPHLLGLRRFGSQGGEGAVRGACASTPMASFPKRRTCWVCGALVFTVAMVWCEVVVRASAPKASSPKRRKCLVCGALGFWVPGVRCEVVVRARQKPLFQSAANAWFATLWVTGCRGYGVRWLCLRPPKAYFPKRRKCLVCGALGFRVPGVWCEDVVRARQKPLFQKIGRAHV